MSFPITESIRDQLYGKGCFVVTEVNFDVVRKLISWILNNRPQRNEFTIVINSSGGDPKAVVYLATFFRTLSSDVRVVGVAFCECGSAALALFQLCHERYAMLNTGFFIHSASLNGSIQCDDPDFEGLKERVESLKQVQDELVEIQCHRSGLTREQWQKLAACGNKNPGTVILAREAKRLGLVDRILVKLNLF